jgi:hypothetical protein
MDLQSEDLDTLLEHLDVIKLLQNMVRIFYFQLIVFLFL